MNVPELKWKQHNGFLECLDLPEWNHVPGVRYRWSITIEPRPAYCDRGRFIVRTDAPLDNQEGFPRYYFDLEIAKQEMASWVAGRAELRV